MGLVTQCAIHMKIDQFIYIVPYNPMRFVVRKTYALLYECLLKHKNMA